MKKKKIYFILIVCTISIFISIFIFYPHSKYDNNIQYDAGYDMFGIQKIYSDKENGRQWHLTSIKNSNDPFVNINPKQLHITEDSNSFSIYNTTHFRLNILSPEGSDYWHNVEITGFFKINSILHSSNLEKEEDDTPTGITLRSRSGQHNSNIPCEGTALDGILLANGISQWKKEIWHTGGYTNPEGIKKIDISLLDKWIGWKVVVYNLDDHSVKMESFMDYEGNNTWEPVTSYIDNGSWYAKNSDGVFEKANCMKSKNHVLLDPKPIITFRSDNLDLSFKNLSIREIIVNN